MKTFETNPNQKKILIDKVVCDSRNKYTSINLDALQNAMVALSNADFKIWMYLAKNKDGYELALSPAEAELNWGIKKSTMHETIRKFEKEGYLEKDERTGNYYVFHEMPIVK